MNIQFTEYTAIVLVRTEKFNQWISDANKKADVEDETLFQGDYSTYLVKNVITPKEVENFVAGNFRALFENELDQWHDKEFWPEELTLDMFYQWVTIQTNREVFLT